MRPVKKYLKPPTDHLLGPFTTEPGMMWQVQWTNDGLSDIDSLASMRVADASWMKH
jgi:hypothetical protein